MKRIELHTHLEGSLTPDRLVALASKYGQPGLPLTCLNATGDAFKFNGFLGFLDLFKDATSVIRTPADFHAVTLDLGEQLARDNVSYAEVIVSYGVMQVRDMDPVPVQKAIREAADQILESRGITMRFVPDAIRQFGLDHAMRAWEAAATCGRQLGVVGFGIGGDEANGPASGFSGLFAEVRGEGLGVSIHAGELTSMGQAGADSVRQAVEDCGATRIGHGLAAASDPLVMGLLAAREVFVEMCPRSNVKTGNLEQLADHPLRIFLDAGIPCCLNTDDRTMFGLDLTSEYDEAAAVFHLTEKEIAAMQDQARRAAFSDLPAD